MAGATTWPTTLWPRGDCAGFKPGPGRGHATPYLLESRVTDVVVDEEDAGNDAENFVQQVHLRDSILKDRRDCSALAAPAIKVESFFWN